MKNFVFPLNNGLALVKDGRYCLAFIDCDGQKRVRSKNEKIGKGWSVPFLRGILYFFVGIFSYIKTLILEDEMNSRTEEEKTKSYTNSKQIEFISKYLLLFATILLAFIYGFVILGFGPSFILETVLKIQDRLLLRFLISLFRTLIIYLSFVLLRFLPYMQSFFKFNSIGQNLLSGKKVSVSNFLNFIVIVCLFSTFVISLVAINVLWIANFFINLALFLFLIGLSYEILSLIEKAKTNLFRDFSFITTWLVFIKPSITQIEISNMVQIEIENQNDEKYENGEVPLSSLFAEMKTKLEANERYEKSDVEWIIANVLGVNRAELKLKKSVSKEEAKKILSYCGRRAKGEPLSSIFGFVDFYGCKIEVNKKVLSPRMETELLVDECLKKIKKDNLKTVLDLCTGSGAIAIAIAKNSTAQIYASDLSKQALTVAKFNAEQNNVKVEFVHSDLFSSIKKKFDLIVSNPPYIKTKDIEKLDKEVKDYDPKMALDGGTDGYEFYRKIVKFAPSFLKKSGYLFFEVGKGQAQKIASLMKAQNFLDIKVLNDYNKIERIVYGRIDK